MVSSRCAICGKEADKKCSTCKSAVYCSAGCQKLDWPLNKLLCKKLVNFLQNNPRPIAEEGSEGEGLEDESNEESWIRERKQTMSYKLAILFPVDSKDIEFV